MLTPESREKFNSVLAKELDKALTQKAVTGLFIDNVLQANFIGAKTVLIPEVDMQALGNYNRDTGFVEGTVSISNTPYVLSMDRGRSFQIDREDADESGIPELMSKVSSEFVRTKVIPELDAYVLSKLAQLALTNAAITGDPTTAALKMLQDAIIKAQEAAGFDEELVAFVDGKMLNALQNSEEISRHLVMNDFKKGELHTQVTSLNGVAILPVPDSRMKTAYNFFDGTTAGQEDGGFTPAANAKSIGLLLVPRRAASLIKKTEQVRCFDPAHNLKADAWKLDYRLYYDVVLKDSLKGGICTYVY